MFLLMQKNFSCFLLTFVVFPYWVLTIITSILYILTVTLNTSTLSSCEFCNAFLEQIDL